MKLKRVAILTNSIVNIDYLIKTISQKYDIDDIIIFSDSNQILDIGDYAIFSSFYLKFFDGSVVFTNTDDYLAYKDTIVSNEIFLLSDADDLIAANIDRSILVKNKTTLIAKESAL